MGQELDILRPLSAKAMHSIYQGTYCFPFKEKTEFYSTQKSKD